MGGCANSFCTLSALSALGLSALFTVLVVHYSLCAVYYPSLSTLLTVHLVHYVLHSGLSTQLTAGSVYILLSVLSPLDIVQSVHHSPSTLSIHSMHYSCTTV